MLNQSELSSIPKGESIDHFLLVKKCELRLTKAGKEYLSLELGDKSTSSVSNLWEDTSGFKSIKNTLAVGDVVKIAGSMDEYQGNPQIKIDSIRLSKQSDDVTPKDFLPKSLRDLKLMKKEFAGRMEKIASSELNSLMKNIFTDERFDKYTSVPAGKMWHHGYISGLIEHTLEIIRICDLMCDIHPEINRDLLVCGAMLHDFGKIEELSFDPVFEYTDKGKLLGHIVIAAMIVNDEINKTPNFPENLKNNLLHLILSHQGKLEYASPVVPKTLEAITLYQADELSAKVNAYKNVIANEIKPGTNWTKFITLAGTDIHSHGLTNPTEENNKTLFD
ncbi:MAG: HD domain-containing protein [Ignavibacteriaceae bacterium]|nr:HD domain-containing protein [Ignavibacterium sp.]MCC6253657.1 HD domain-containing protein [Ignavibacteriaceae bacterium]HMN23125.1 HD domain-containing protein [Ignavibacteriaceae bacterium]HRN25990.1 HD domain-containing protein [Ignavibacteriaceae bacterium]HRP91366.1 HD domain-containing protein [Ignavibacteriaceae bacterium]